jgi:hypothetical protein
MKARFPRSDRVSLLALALNLLWDIPVPDRSQPVVIFERRR